LVAWKRRVIFVVYLADFEDLPSAAAAAAAELWSKRQLENRVTWLESLIMMMM